MHERNSVLQNQNLFVLRYVQADRLKENKQPSPHSWKTLVIFN